MCGDLWKPPKNQKSVRMNLKQPLAASLDGGSDNTTEPTGGSAKCGVLE